MNEISSARIAHLSFIQDSIKSYNHERLFCKAAALVVAAGAFIVQVNVNTPGVVSLFALGAAFILLVLWLQDTHYYQTKCAYAKLHDVSRTAEETHFDMDVDQYRTKNTFANALWAPPASWLYMGLIFIVALLSLF